jgi:hypothetical protein
MDTVDVNSPIPHKDLPAAHDPAVAPPGAPHYKQIHMKVAWHAVGKFYVCVETTNTSWYVPGEHIPKERVDLINNDAKGYPNWTIDHVDYDYFAAVVALLGALTGAAAQQFKLPVLP